jgi:hypothetical protein
MSCGVAHCYGSQEASLPGIAVRRTASLPLAYARQSIVKKMDARIKSAHDGSLISSRAERLQPYPFDRA